MKANIHQATLLLATVASNNVASWRQQCCPVYGSDFAMLCVASNMLPQLDHCSIPGNMLLATVVINNVA